MPTQYAGTLFTLRSGLGKNAYTETQEKHHLHNCVLSLHAVTDGSDAGPSSEQGDWRHRCQMSVKLDWQGCSIVVVGFASCHNSPKIKWLDV